MGFGGSGFVGWSGRVDVGDGSPASEVVASLVDVTVIVAVLDSCFPGKVVAGDSVEDGVEDGVEGAEEDGGKG